MTNRLRLFSMLLIISHQANAIVLDGSNASVPASSQPQPTPSTVQVSPTSMDISPNPAALKQLNNELHDPAAMKQINDKLNNPELIKKLNANLNASQLQATARSLQPANNNPNNTAPPPEQLADTQPNSNSDEDNAPPPSLDQIKNQQAFNSLLDEVLPLSPDQLMKLHKFYDLTLQAKAATPTAPPTPHFTSTVVSLDPGSTPPVVRLAAGFVTSLIFVDSTGSAWPVTAYSIGDPQTFNIQWDQKSNAMFIQSLKPYAHGNLAIRLLGLDTPVMITLVSGQRNVDFRVDLQISGRGPDAKAPVIETPFSAKVNPLLMNLLDGIPPKGSIKLEVVGGQGEAWHVDNKIFFRTKLTLLSPAWVASVSSADGTHVYELMQTPYIIASQNGKAIDIKLSGL